MSPTATTNRFPNILLRQDHAFPQLLKHRGAKTGEGRLFRPVRQCRRGEPHAQHAATRLSAALLLGLGIRVAHPALPAVPDQALLARRASAASTRPVYARAGARSGTLPDRQKPRRAGPAGQGDEQRRRKRSISKPRPSLRDRLRAMSHMQLNAGHQSLRPSPKPICSRRSAKAARPASRCSSSAPDRIGATGPIFRATPREMPTGEVLEAFIGQFYDERTAPRLILLSEDNSRTRELLGEALALRAEHKVEVSRARARRKARDHRDGAQQCARATRPPPGRERAQRELLDGVADAVRPGRAAQAHRGL